MFSSAVARSNFAAAAPTTAAALALSVSQLATLHTAFLVGYLSGHMPAGILADRFGGARVLLIAGICWSLITCAHLCTSALPPHSAFVLLAVLRFGIGATTAAAVPALGATLAQLLPEHLRARIQSASYGFFNLGTAVTIGFTPALCDSTNFSLAMAGMGLVALAPLVLFKPLLPVMARYPCTRTPWEDAADPGSSGGSALLAGMPAAQSGFSDFSERRFSSGPRMVSSDTEDDSADSAYQSAVRAAVGSPRSSSVPPTDGHGSVAVGSPADPRNARSEAKAGAQMRIRATGTQRQTPDAQAEADAGTSASGGGGVDMAAWSDATGQVKEARDDSRLAMRARDGKRSWTAMFALVFCHSVIGWLFFTFAHWIPEYLHSLSIGGAAELGAASALPWVATAGTSFAFGALFSWLRGCGLTAFTSQSVAHTCACLGAAAALLPLARTATPSPALALACMGSALAVQACNYSGFHAYVQTFGAERAGSILGFTNSCGIVAGMVANCVLARTVEQTGSYSAYFGMTVVVCASSWAMWVVCLRGEQIKM